MAEKVTVMKLKVDLQCHKCHKKVKKVLTKFPQIRDQAYDEKQNIVTIKVVCCNPEKIRDKLCCKGGGAIKIIEIVEDDKPKEKQPPPPGFCCASCYHGQAGGPCFYGYYGRPVCDSYGGGRLYCVCHCDQYYYGENSSGCSVM